VGVRMTRHFFGMLASVLLVISVSANGQSVNTEIEHGAAANREYAAVFSRSEKPCSQNYATMPYVDCMSKELKVIEAHLDAFVDDLRGMTLSHEELDALNQSTSQ
jgi:hypothetical protein